MLLPAGADQPSSRPQSETAFKQHCLCCAGSVPLKGGAKGKATDSNHPSDAIASGIDQQSGKKGTLTGASGLAPPGVSLQPLDTGPALPRGKATGEPLVGLAQHSIPRGSARGTEDLCCTSSQQSPMSPCLLSAEMSSGSWCSSLAAGIMQGHVGSSLCRPNKGACVVTGEPSRQRCAQGLGLCWSGRDWPDPAWHNLSRVYSRNLTAVSVVWVGPVCLDSD